MGISMLINGVPGDQISACDRGLQYGDGIFRTMRAFDGQLRLWPRHYRKLQQDCAALSILCPEATLLLDELHGLIKQQPDGVAKIIITRGKQEKRGYAPAADTAPTRILSITPAPDYPHSFHTQGITLRVCDLRLSHQPKLAGVKHLNRLENVLAAAEWNDAEIAEGLMLDIQGNVIEGTRSNLFMVRDGALLTPDLSRCGVAGIQRERVMEQVIEHGVPCQVSQIALAELLAADEVFLVNSIIGLWPVRELRSRTWNQLPMSRQVQEWLNHAPD